MSLTYEIKETMSSIRKRIEFKQAINYVKFKNLVYEEIQISLKYNKEDYGFVLNGYCPCYVESIVEHSVAELSGLKRGDLVIKVNGTNCCRATIKSIMSIIKTNSKDILTLVIYRRLSDSQKAFAISRQFGKSNSIFKKPTQNTPSKKSEKVNFISKLLRPSKWLSCAQTGNTTIASTYMVQSCMSLQSNEYVLCTKECCKFKHSVEIIKTESDAGYETISRYCNSTDKKLNDSNFSIETVTNTTNSYTECDLTLDRQEIKERLDCEKLKLEKFNQIRTKLIGDLIELEANFVSFLSVAVATFSRPLRGFFIQQQDYFTLFQNIEKILIISENFLRSMDKWSAYDLYTKIGQLYTQKMSLFKEAFATYVKGYPKARDLLNELKSHSKQFRLFLSEAQSNNLTLANLIDLPIVHMQKTMDLFKQIRMYTIESKRNPSEAPRIDSVIVELKKILNLINSNDLKLNQVCYNDEIMENSETFSEDDNFTIEDCSTTFFMDDSLASSIEELTVNEDSTASSEY